jgi:hypothetical protein
MPVTSPAYLAPLSSVVFISTPLVFLSIVLSKYTHKKPKLRLRCRGWSAPKDGLSFYESQ